MCTNLCDMARPFRTSDQIPIPRYRVLATIGREHLRSLDLLRPRGCERSPSTTMPLALRPFVPNLARANGLHDRRCGVARTSQFHRNSKFGSTLCRSTSFCRAEVLSLNVAVSSSCTREVQPRRRVSRNKSRGVASSTAAGAVICASSSNRIVDPSAT
jgi:hypothetical protein